MQYKLVLHAPRGQERMYGFLAKTFEFKHQKHPRKNKAKAFIDRTQFDAIQRGLNDYVARGELTSVKYKIVRP